jgi:hypothetical protein
MAISGHQGGNGKTGEPDGIPARFKAANDWLMEFGQEFLTAAPATCLWTTTRDGRFVSQVFSSSEKFRL